MTPMIYNKPTQDGLHYNQPEFSLCVWIVSITNKI